MNVRATKRSLHLFFKGLIVVIIFIFSEISSNSQIISQGAANDTLIARKDFIDYLIKWTKWNSKQERYTDEKKVQFSLMPLSGEGSENGITISSINASFHLGDKSTTKLSNVVFYPTTDFVSYLNFLVFPNLWAKNNSWNIPGKFEYSYTKRRTYGFGTDTPEDSLFYINYNSVIAHLSVNREIFENFFVGAGYYLDYFYNIEQEWDKDYQSSFEKYEYGTSETSLSSGLAFNVLYDSRRNPINALGGLYSSLSIVVFDPAFGSQYRWKSLLFDTRRYISLSSFRHSIIAFRGLAWSSWGEVPYLNIPGTRLGEATWTGRGYYKGRYRGNHMLYAEAEYRFDISTSGLWGGVVFANGQSMSEPDNKGFKHVKPAAGFGLRLKFNKFSDSNLTTDLAFGKGSVVWFVGLNEAF